MKKLLYILLAIALVVGGILVMNKYQENALVKEAQKKAPQIIKKNFENVDFVEVSSDLYTVYPKDLGGVSVSGQINGDEDLYFSVDFQTDGNKLGSVTSIAYPPEFPPLRKECGEDFCN